MYMFTFSVLSFHHHFVYRCHLYCMYIHMYILIVTQCTYIYILIVTQCTYIYMYRLIFNVCLYMCEHTCTHGLCSNILYFSLHLFAFKVKLIMVTPGNTANMQ